MQEVSGLVDPVLGEQQGAQVTQRFKLGGPQCERLAQAGFRIVQLAGLQQGVAEQVVRIGIVRCEPDRLAVARHGVFQLALTLQCHTKGMVGEGLIRREQHCPPPAGFGLGVTAQTTLGRSKLDPGFRVSRVGFADTGK